MWKDLIANTMQKYSIQKLQLNSVIWIVDTPPELMENLYYEVFWKEMQFYCFC